MLTFVALSGCAEVTGRVPWQLPAAAGAFPMERFAYGWVCCRCQIPPAVSEGGRRGLAVGRDHILATLGRELQITVVNYGDVFSQLELISWLWPVSDDTCTTSSAIEASPAQYARHRSAATTFA